MSLTSTQMALELPLEACCHGIPRLLSQLSPELPTPWGCAGLTPTLPGRAGPHSCCAQDPSAEVRRGEMGADFPEPSFKVEVNCQSCSTSELPLLWGACLRRECQGRQPPGASPRDFHRLGFCARLECFLCSHGSFQRPEARLWFLAKNWKEEVMAHVRDKSSRPATMLFPACFSLQRPSF